MSEDTKPIKRKLIEVALPLEAINKASAREKSIRHGHPSTMHLWWSRKPLATVRAVLFAQLVDDPSSHPDRFPTEESQTAERERLHNLIERLVLWENTGDTQLFAEAHAEILKSTGGNPPPILDPFAGGGTIPLEAQRLGLVARGSDLNPVAVLINKALVEIPGKFAGRPPVFPDLANQRIESWEGATGLAADVRAYGTWILEQLKTRLGHHYPDATLPDGTKAPVIAWIWARTVECPNPACGIEMPLVQSWWLAKKPGKEAWVEPTVVPDQTHPSGKRVEFKIVRGADQTPSMEVDGTMNGRRGCGCVACGAMARMDYVRERAAEKPLAETLIAVVAKGDRQRIYLPPSAEQLTAVDVERPADSVIGETSRHPQYMGAPRYGMTHWADLFTNRQLLALTTLSDLVSEARQAARTDARTAGLPEGDRLAAGGSGAAAYADAVATYLGLAPGALANLNSSLTTWRVPAESPRTTFPRHALAMAWGFVESPAIVKIEGVLDRISLALAAVPGAIGHASQIDATKAVSEPAVLSTDPPYYDNIPYGDLSDFFYVWLRRSLRDVHPELLSTILVPKTEELIADTSRHGGPDGARAFFEAGFNQVFASARKTAVPDFPITVYYAFKQADVGEDGTSSTGWETLLDGMIRSGWEITSTWPMRTEAVGRMRGVGANALASSIVLSLRPRSDSAPTADRRSLIHALQSELPDALRKLQQSAIAPVDLPQAAIGPGMAVFSRYAKVIESDGSAMTVRSALARINEILDQVLAEQEGDFDPHTRFAIAWYRQHGYKTGNFGDADNLARARNTSVDTMERAGILNSIAGKVTLLAPATLSDEYDVLNDDSVSSWEVLHHLIAFTNRDGIPAAGAFLSDARERPEVDTELIKELTYLLYGIADKNSWTQDAIAFNTVATSWPEIVEASRSSQAATKQSTFDFEEDN